MAFKIESSLLDACALAILHRGDTYGYEITQEMKKSITVSESTLYPVLRRLEAAGSLTVYSVEHNSRLRKYYAITDEGRKKIADFLAEWAEVKRVYDFIAEVNVGV